ncbi:MAG: ComEA family DNA-binding protein [Ignavibacteria bacterium]
MKKLLAKTGLSYKELSVIGFLLITFSAGLIFKYSGLKKPNEYDYSETDKNFESKLKSSFDELKSTAPDSTKKLRANEISALADSLGVAFEKNASEQKVIKPGTRININTALAADLTVLPGVGVVMAERIIEYREQNGNFKKPEDIMKVKGIGEKKFEKIKDFVVVE